MFQDMISGDGAAGRAGLPPAGCKTPISCPSLLTESRKYLFSRVLCKDFLIMAAKKLISALNK